MPYVDPRNIYKSLFSAGQVPAGVSAADPSTAPTGTGPGPDGGPQQPPPASSGGDFWNQFLAKIKPVASEAGYNQVAGSYSQLAGLLDAAQKAFGGSEGILKYMDYNPMKGLYSVRSFLNNTPYYDSSGVDANGNQMYKPFYVPGFDYDPNTPGIQAPSWAGTPYTQGMHAFRT